MIGLYKAYTSKMTNHATSSWALKYAILEMHQNASVLIKYHNISEAGAFLACTCLSPDNRSIYEHYLSG